MRSSRREDDDDDGCWVPDIVASDDAAMELWTANLARGDIMIGFEPSKAISYVLGRPVMAHAPRPLKFASALSTRGTERVL